MRLRFRPMPGLTVATVISLIILISLGTWQYHRLQWKTGVLAEIEQAATAAPFQGFNEVKQALADDEPIDFRRIGISADLRSMPYPFYVFSAENKDISWRPYRLADNNGIVVFVAQDLVPDREKEDHALDAQDAVDIVGYVRLARENAQAAKQSSPGRNRWFGFNPLPETHDWGDVIPDVVETRYYIDQVPRAVSADALPVKRPRIANNHLDYMLTWYGLALTLLVIYLIMHHREGRLTWR